MVPIWSRGARARKCAGEGTVRRCSGRVGCTHVADALWSGVSRRACAGVERSALGAVAADAATVGRSRRGARRSIRERFWRRTVRVARSIGESERFQKRPRSICGDACGLGPNESCRGACAGRARACRARQEFHVLDRGASSSRDSSASGRSSPPCPHSGATNCRTHARGAAGAAGKLVLMQRCIRAQVRVAQWPFRRSSWQSNLEYACG